MERAIFIIACACVFALTLALSAAYPDVWFVGWTAWLR